MKLTFLLDFCIIDHPSIVHSIFVEPWFKSRLDDAVKLTAVISNIETDGLAIARRQGRVKYNLDEIRSKRASNIQRAIHFHWSGTKYVITQAFTKKLPKTPLFLLCQAKGRRKLFERSHFHE